MINAIYVFKNLLKKYIQTKTKNYFILNNRIGKFISKIF